MMPDDTVAIPSFGQPRPAGGSAGSTPPPDPTRTPLPGVGSVYGRPPAPEDVGAEPADERPEPAGPDGPDDPPAAGGGGGGGDDGDDDAEGVTPGGHRRRRNPWLAALSIVGVLALVCSGTVAALAFGLAHRYDEKVTRQDILGDLPKAEQPIGTKTAPMNFLVLGSDSRETTDARIDNPDGSRSDTIMIVHVNAAHTGAFIVSIPRDSYVNVPAGGNWKGGLNKINAAFAFGGAKLAAKTVYELTKIPLDSAMIVNFDGVQKMVGEVGTVNVCIPYAVASNHTPAVWTAGCHDMGPADVEDFMRQRKSVPGGDFGRIHDQQIVVQALADRITNEGFATNPLQLDRLITTAAESVTVDQSTNLRDLILVLKDIRPANLNFATVPYSGTMNTPAGSSVKLDAAAAATLFQAMIDDKTADWLAAHPQTKPSGN